MTLSKEMKDEEGEVGRKVSDIERADNKMVGDMGQVFSTTQLCKRAIIT